MKRKNIEKCRNLRKNQTEAEKKLWAILRNRQINGMKFRRQFPIDKYIIDFYCPDLRLGVEVDGGKHYETEYLKKDVIRPRQLGRYEIEIIRFSNNEVLSNIEEVVQVINRKLKERKTAHLHPLPQGRGKYLENTLLRGEKNS